MIIVYDTTICTDWHINTCFFEILVTFCTYIDNSSCLTTTDTLCFTSNTDRTTADTNLYKVSTCICKEAETFTIYYVTCTYLYSITIMITDPL